MNIETIMEQRLARIEEKVTSLERERGEDRQDIHIIKATVQRIEVQIATFRFCQAPSTCLLLQPKVDALEKALEQSRGALRIINFLWLGLGSAITALGAFLFKHFTKP